jgi:hypothetical protein
LRSISAERAAETNSEVTPLLAHGYSPCSPQVTRKTKFWGQVLRPLMSEGETVCVECGRQCYSLRGATDFSGGERCWVCNPHCPSQSKAMSLVLGVDVPFVPGDDACACARLRGWISAK